MRIYLSCQQSSTSESPVPAYSFWRAHFVNGLKSGGHTPIESPEINWATGLATKKEEQRRWRDAIWQKVFDDIKKEHKKAPVELFLSYLFPEQIDVGAISAIQQLGIPCVNFFCDNVREHVVVPKEFRVFDLHWVPEKKALVQYERANMSFLYAPMPVCIPQSLKEDDISESYGVTFIGTKDPLREYLLAELLAYGKEIEIRGAHWQETHEKVPQRVFSFKERIQNQLDFLRRYGGVAPWIRKTLLKPPQHPLTDTLKSYIKAMPSDSQYLEILKESIVTLGINRYLSFRHSYSRPDTYSRLRDIEAPMVGACYITEWTEGLEDLYDLDREVLSYGCVEELNNKLDYLLQHPKKRSELRVNAKRRALTDHTVANTLTKIAHELGIR